MYWPLGAPKVYAAAKRRRKAPEADDGDGEVVEAKAKKAYAILGLQVARNGQVFATVTASALTIWQTSVRTQQRRSDRF